MNKRDEKDALQDVEMADEENREEEGEGEAEGEEGGESGREEDDAGEGDRSHLLRNI